MNKILRAAVAAGAAAMLAIASGSTAAHAHSSSQYFTGSKWPLNASISFGVNAGWPGNELAYRMVDAKNQWMQYDQGNEPNVYWALPDYVNYGSWNNPCTLSSGNNTGVIFWQDLDSQGSAVVGYTRACSSNGVRTRITMAFDSTGTSWYWGTGDAPSWTTDLWSVASHEWGHGLGFQVHLPEFTIGVCPTYENVERHSMCPQTFSGFEVQRYPKLHDYHTFQAAY